MQAEVLTKYFVNSEGTEVEQSEPQIRVFATARTKADDGMTLPLYRSYFAFSPENLPSEAQIAEDIRKMIALLKDLRTAPLAETYTGPAILSGEASGVFFHEIFGHRVEGHRQKDANSSQTFKAFVGKKILPDFIDVVFDPTIKSLKNQDIVGYFQYDDEGMPGEKVVAVDDGIFKDFLMSRAPIEGFPTSNGHGRRQAGYKTVSRQSNLLVQSSKSTSFDNLRKQLRAEAKRQGKEYGLYFVEISGGFTFTGRTVPNAFNVQPLVVYKIFADGRPDQLVRGVDLIGTPLTTFNNITAAADDLGIFNGVCGAESGGVPVSASSPSLLVSTIEVQKKSKSQAKLPILPAPAEASRGGN
jgi:predicted Zn-dependent protease